MLAGRPTPVWLLALVLLAPAMAGCWGGDDPGVPGGDESDQGGPGADANRTGPGLVGPVDLRVPLLGLAIYQGVPRDNVAPLVPAGATPVPCFFERPGETVDVVVLASRERYPDLPGAWGSAEPSLVAVLTCAERSEGMAREDTNEPPWVNLGLWVDGETYRGFLDELAAAPPAGDIEIAEGTGGYSFVASTTDGTVIVEGRFAVPGVGVPPIAPCEPAEMRGRSISEAPDGTLVALDWNKTEAVCPAEATMTWPMDSPLASILGPARAPDLVIDTQVDEATYWWRTLPSSS